MNGNIKTLAQIWKGTYPPAAPRQHSLVEKILFTPVLLLRCLSLDQLKNILGNRRKHLFMDLYVLVWLIVLSVALLASDHIEEWVVFLAAYRIMDIVIYRIYFLLVKSQAEPWSISTLRRSFLIVSINFCETIIAYALLYLRVGHIVGTTADTQQPLGRIAALYYSAVTATTLGYGDFVPGDSLSRILVVSQLFTTILFLIFLIPALISIFSTETRDSMGAH